MKEKDIGSLLVKGCQGYVGVLAEPDLVYRLVSEGLDPRTTPLSSIMEESILSIDLCLSFRGRFPDAGIQYQPSGRNGK
jgi:CBS domain-containing protein